LARSALVKTQQDIISRSLARPCASAVVALATRKKRKSKPINTTHSQDQDHPKLTVESSFVPLTPPSSRTARALEASIARSAHQKLSAPSPRSGPSFALPPIPAEAEAADDLGLGMPPLLDPEMLELDLGELDLPDIDFIV
jgi:hypothetical protein